ncbi:hypothetical protein GCM10008985_30270 [Halococcus dombrowskii]|uniref:Ricin B lectin domain-containing protein n=1 Tax=Halococcus dombrowskii TaxID=179637 RepID=A0AAV3SKF0_HALDO
MYSLAKRIRLKCWDELGRLAIIFLYSTTVAQYDWKTCSGKRYIEINPKANNGGSQTWLIEHGTTGKQRPSLESNRTDGSKACLWDLVIPK